MANKFEYILLSDPETRILFLVARWRPMQACCDAAALMLLCMPICWKRRYKSTSWWTHEERHAIRTVGVQESAVAADTFDNLMALICDLWPGVYDAVHCPVHGVHSSLATRSVHLVHRLTAFINGWSFSTDVWLSSLFSHLALFNVHPTMFSPWCCPCPVHLPRCRSISSFLPRNAL